MRQVLYLTEVRSNVHSFITTLTHQRLLRVIVLLLFKKTYFLKNNGEIVNVSLNLKLIYF
ncbi:hypothetical protein NTGM5_520004 [Candidatus Nitrotoga sp. M5]|nr:hypothetical protein NTGM5_520004 [Candidatus Nitrotoga sp. M5]